MRRSPWCVSDMKNPRACEGSRVGALLPARGALRDARRAGTFSDAAAEAGAIEPPAHTTAPRTGPEEIGRASCRERVQPAGVAGATKRRNTAEQETQTAESREPTSSYASSG